MDKNKFFNSNKQSYLVSLVVQLQKQFMTPDKQLCSLHKKEKTIFCVDKNVSICQYCAIFSQQFQNCVLIEKDNLFTSCNTLKTQIQYGIQCLMIEKHTNYIKITELDNILVKYFEKQQQQINAKYSYQIKTLIQQNYRQIASLNHERTNLTAQMNLKIKKSIEPQYLQIQNTYQAILQQIQQKSYLEIVRVEKWMKEALMKLNLEMVSLKIDLENKLWHNIKAFDQKEEENLLADLDEMEINNLTLEMSFNLSEDEESLNFCEEEFCKSECDTEIDFQVRIYQ